MIPRTNPLESEAIPAHVLRELLVWIKAQGGVRRAEIRGRMEELGMCISEREASSLIASMNNLGHLLRNGQVYALTSLGVSQIDLLSGAIPHA